MPLDLDLCQRLKALGFPQNRFPQLIWERPLVSWAGHPRLVFWAPVDTTDWCAAPEALDVLDWLEREKGWHYCRADDDHWLAWTATGERRHPMLPVPKEWLVTPLHRDGCFDTAPELIRAILDKLETG